MDNEVTLEIFKLVIGPDEVESSDAETVSEYLIERAAFYGNQLAQQHKKIKEFKLIRDSMSRGYVLVFMCESWF